MPQRLSDRNADPVRRLLLLGGAAAVCMPTTAGAQAKATVRIGLPTKTYFPTIIAETAIRQKLFEKEGVNPELTIYRGGRKVSRRSRPAPRT